MKPFIFVGDSITWGEGLELYDEKFNKVYSELTNKEEFKFFELGHLLFSGYAPIFREKNRFSDLVSNHFDNVYLSNGISENNIEALNYVIDLHKRYGSDKFSDVIINLCSTNHDEHITSYEKLKQLFGLEFKVFELQKIVQAWYDYCGEFGVKVEIASNVGNFNKYFSNTSITIESIERLQSYFFQPDNFRKFLIQNSYQHLEDKLSELDELNIRYHIILPWTSHDFENYKKLSQKFDFELTDKVIPIIYNDSKYESIAELHDEKSLWVKEDFPWSNCSYISPKGHKVISESIIKHLENLDM